MNKKLIPEPDEFFVGYMPQAPAKTMSVLKWVVVTIGIGMVAVGILVVVSQREFSSANFEYGKYNTVEGFIFKSPIPHIKVTNGVDSLGNPRYKTLLLAGIGKAGADKTISLFEKTVGDLEGKYVALQGQLIDGEGKSLLQISIDHVPTINANVSSISIEINSLGTETLEGEIVDPKCYFGVMKPGEGKPHRSCAIRCIAGGMPPVFHVSGSSEYYVLVDENSQPVNDRVLNIVGDKISLTGKTFSFDNWKILQVKKDNLKEQVMSATLVRNLVAMKQGMTVCEMN